MEVVTDVRGLLSDDSVLNELAPTTFREFNTDQMLSVQSPGHSHMVLISKEGEVGAGEYLDPKGKQVVQFDHIRQEVTGARAVGGELDQSMEATRVAFEGAMSQYTTDHYKDGTCTVYAKDKGIQVCISAARFNPKNFWNGRWRSQWACKNNGKDWALTGKIRTNVHFYEDGNVQLISVCPTSLTCPGGDAAKSSQEVMKAI